MKWSILAAVAVGVAFSLVAPAGAQYGANRVETRKQCLSEDDLLIIKTIQSLKRATNSTDPELPFNPDALLGTWNLSWVNSDVPWSPAGDNEGTLTVKYVESCYYEGQIESTGPTGKYRVDIRMLYHPGSKHLTWIETDSRGFTVVRDGDVGGHGPTSQQFDYIWEAMPFTYQGKTIRMAGSMFLTSPTHVRQDVVLSVDGEMTQRLGAPTLDK